MTDYFNHIYDETYHDVLRYVISKCKDLTYVEDIMQNIYTTVYKVTNRKGKDYIDNYKAFVVKLAKRELYKYYLFKSRTKNINNADEVIDSLIDENQLSIDDQIFQSITNEKIWEEIKKENIINQKIMVLYYLENATIKTIASLLNINENTVKSRLYRTLSRLKEKFGDKS